MSVDDAHTRPTGTSDATVAALGKLSEALEVIEDARGQLLRLPPQDRHGRPRPSARP